MNGKYLIAAVVLLGVAIGICALASQGARESENENVVVLGDIGPSQGSSVDWGGESGHYEMVALAESLVNAPEILDSPAISSGPFSLANYDAPDIVIDWAWGGESGHYEMDYKTALETGFIVEDLPEILDSPAISSGPFSLTEEPCITDSPAIEIVAEEIPDEPTSPIEEPESELGSVGTLLITSGNHLEAPTLLMTSRNHFEDISLGNPDGET